MFQVLQSRVACKSSHIQLTVKIQNIKLIRLLVWFLKFLPRSWYGFKVFLSNWLSLCADNYAGVKTVVFFWLFTHIVQQAHLVTFLVTCKRV